MKILMLHGMIPEAYGGKFAGGASKVAWELSRVMSKEHEVYLYPLHDYTKSKVEGINIIPRKKIKTSIQNFPSLKCFNKYSTFLKKHGYSKKQVYYFSISNCIQERYIREAILKINPDIIHIHGIAADRLFSIFLSLEFLKIGTVLTSHGLIGYSPDSEGFNIPQNLHNRREFEKTVFNKVISKEKSIITAVSSKVRDMIIEKYNIPQYRVVAIPNGISEEFFHPSSKNKKILRKKFKLPINKKIFLTVGTLSKRKNQILVLKALPKMPKDIRDQIYYVMVGNGPEKTKLEEFVKDQNLSDIVRFLGYLTGQDLIDVYWASDYFILTATNEGAPLVFLEAMAAGLPVITMKGLEGIEDIFINGNSSLVEVKDYTNNHVRESIHKALNKKWDFNEIREISRKFLWNKISYKYLLLYSLLLEKEGETIV